MIKAADLVRKCVEMHENGFGYVLGAQGELYSSELAEKWGNAGRCGKTKSYFTRTCAKWYGHRIVDCSGMIIEAIRSKIAGYPDNTADGLYSMCAYKSSDMSTIPDTAGVCVHKKGHIGVYMGGGEVVEAKGAAYGVVVTNLKDTKWTGWGRLADVDYSQSCDDFEEKKSTLLIMTRLLKRRLVMMRGSDVAELQRALLENGYSAGECDGIFGNKTKAAVKAFQEAKGLKIDGIAGKETCGALGGVWVG